MAIVTLAVATRNDFTGLWFTLNSALLSVRNTPLENELAFSVINNSDDKALREQISSYCAKHGVPYKELVHAFSNSVARAEAVKQSTTPYTVLADSHVLFSHGFFAEYVTVLEQRPEVGLIHCPFTAEGGMPHAYANCFYNLQKFESNLHGSFSRRGSSHLEPYPVALAPHVGYGFRTQQWLDYGGYMPECLGNGGGEPYVTYKYWMFGSSAWVTPHAGLIHHTSKPYKRNRGQWLRNHTLVAAALGGYEVGKRYARSLRCSPIYEELWQLAKPYHDFIAERARVPFTELQALFREKQARPFV